MRSHGGPWERGNLSLLAIAWAVLFCLCSAPGWSAEPSKPGQADAGPFGDFDEEDAPTRERLQGLLREVPEHLSEIVEIKKAGRPMCRVAGLFRLEGAWAENTLLRMSLSEPSRLQLHFWNGAQGVTLHYYPQYHKSWAAYGTLREGEAPRPSKYALWATDEGRYQRCGAGTFDVHYGRGRLTMIRGDVLLLSAPLDGPPTQVYVQSSGLVRGLSLLSRTAEPGPPGGKGDRHLLPAGPFGGHRREALVVAQKVPVPFSAAFSAADRRQPFLGTSRPAELPWESSLAAGIAFAALPEGQVELSADDKTQQAQVWTTVRRPGLYEYLFEVESPGVGTGVYLGDEQGKPLARVGFFHYAAARQTTFELGSAWSRDATKRYEPERQMVPFASRRQWLRVVMGAGVAKLWTSGDAVHWSQTAPKAESAPGACWSVGLYCLPGQTRRSIRLCSLEVRQLDAVASLAPESVQQYVGALVDAENLESWEQQVAETRPTSVDPDLWWRACAVRTLARSAKASFGQQLLDRLQERVVSEPGDPQALVRFLEESTLLRSNEDWNAADRVALLAERLGLGLMCQGEASPSTVVSGVLARLSFWTPRRLPMFSEKLVRHELLTRIGEGSPEAVREFCQRMGYWSRVEPRGGEQPWSRDLRHLLAWALEQSARPLPAKDRDKPGPAPAEWRHPLIERLSREGYNVLAELQAALDNKAYREASQIVSTSVKADGLGLLPDKRDGRLLVSMPVAVEAAMREHPALGKTMQEQYGPLSRLRLQQAIQVGDVPAVEAVAIQFLGTESAAEANQWLGDRALAGGRFAEAISRYTVALRSASAEQRDDLSARLRLAGAMTGADVGRPIRAPVQIGKMRISPQGFERGVQQLRQTHRQAGEPTAGQPAASHSAPAPGRYEGRPWAQIDGQPVRRPTAIPDRGIDWAGRQTSVLVSGRQMFVSNRVQQFAFELPGGRQQWVQQRSLDARDQPWPLLAMQPVAVGGRMFVRRLGGEGPELACLETADGRLVWSCRPGGHVASDPLVLSDGLYVFSAGYAATGDGLSLSLVGLGMESGQVRIQVPLAEFRDYWRRQIPCQAVVAGDRMVATVGGCVLCCDASGRLHWLRRQIWIAPPGDNYWSARAWFEQSHDPPLVDGARVYATQPGVWGVECLDLDTGRLVWRQAVGGLTRVIGRTSRSLIVEAGEQIFALGLDSGRPIWCRDVKGRLEAQLCGRPEVLLCIQTEPNPQSSKTPRLAMLWIDPDSGRQVLRSILDVPARPAPWLKPLVVSGDRQWVFVASAEQAARREILELVRTGEGKTAQVSVGSAKDRP